MQRGVEHYMWLWKLPLLWSSEVLLSSPERNVNRRRDGGF